MAADELGQHTDTHRLDVLIDVCIEPVVNNNIPLSVIHCIALTIPPVLNISNRALILYLSHKYTTHSVELPVGKMSHFSCKVVPGVQDNQST